MGYKAELEAKIQKLKQVAIDAYMVFEGGMFVVEGDKYRQVGEGGFLEPTCYVARPDENGAGGGDWWSFPPMPDIFGLSAEYRSNFDAIRAHIDALFDPWIDLPESAMFEVELGKLREVLGRLHVGRSGESGSVVGSGDLATNLRLAEMNLIAMSGATIGAFKANFLAKLSLVAENIRGLGLILGDALAAELKIFEELSAKVLELVDEAIKVFAAIAEAKGSGEFAFSLVLMLGSALAGAAATVITGGAALPAALVGKAFTFVDALSSSVNEASIKGGGNTYSKAMESLGGALSSMSGALLEAETKIEDNLKQNLERAHGNKSAFDISLDESDVEGRGELESGENPRVRFPEEGEKVIEKGLVDEIIDTYLKAAAKELNEAARSPEASMTMAAYRRGEIGMAKYGPADSFYEFYNLLRELLLDLSSDVQNGAIRLRLAVDDILGNDQDLGERYSRLARRIEHGSGINPWDDKRDG